MFLRSLLSLVLGLAALAIGLLTAVLASKNRALGADLDATQRWCETYQRQNALLASRIEQEEFQLLHPERRTNPSDEPFPAGPE